MDDNWYRDNLESYNKIATVSSCTAYEFHVQKIICEQLQEHVNDLKSQYEKLETKYEKKKLKYDSAFQMEKVLLDNIQKTNELISAKEAAMIAEKKELGLRQANMQKVDERMFLFNLEFRKLKQETIEYCEQLPLAQKRKELQNQLLKKKIALAIVKQNYNEMLEKKKLLNDIQLKRKTLLHVKFARLMLDYKNMLEMENELKKHDNRLLKLTTEIVKDKRDMVRETVFVEPRTPQPEAAPAHLNMNTLVPLSPICFKDFASSYRPEEKRVNMSPVLKESAAKPGALKRSPGEGCALPLKRPMIVRPVFERAERARPPAEPRAGGGAPDPRGPQPDAPPAAASQLVSPDPDLKKILDVSSPDFVYQSFNAKADPRQVSPFFKEPQFPKAAANAGSAPEKASALDMADEHNDDNMEVSHTQTDDNQMDYDVTSYEIGSSYVLSPSDNYSPIPSALSVDVRESQPQSEEPQMSKNIFGLFTDHSKENKCSLFTFGEPKPKPNSFFNMF